MFLVFAYQSRSNGTEVMVECLQGDVVDPPTLGSIITVKHEGTYANGKLRSPTFWRIREDINWKDAKSKSCRKVLPSSSSNNSRHLWMLSGLRKTII